MIIFKNLTHHTLIIIKKKGEKKCMNKSLIEVNLKALSTRVIETEFTANSLSIQPDFLKYNDKPYTNTVKVSYNIYKLLKNER